MNTYAPNPDVVSTELEGETVLLDLTSRHYYSLNETATRVWQHLVEGKRPPEIAAAVSAEWEISEEDAESSVVAFLDSLAAEKLVAKR